MSVASDNNKRIAKNTMYLYLRMLLSLVVQLYTSRVILNALGISDYGIYNVVGGVVVMFSFLSGTMATAAQRFMSYAIGRNDMEDLRKTFVVSQIILWVIAVLTLVAIEIIGMWLLFNYLSIPNGRLSAAIWVFQVSAVSLFITIISVPYNAAIIAHEKMSVYAGFSLIDIFAKLGVAVLLLYLSETVDKLIVYSVLLMLFSVLMRACYTIYCNRNFEECSHNIYRYDKIKGQQMLSFFGWNIIGAFSYVSKEQGVNVLINIFFGTVVNAARGVTAQVTGAVQGFISNFQVAMNPQITKYYAQRDFDNLFTLVQRGAKFSLFLYFFLALPLYIDIDYILKLWLINVPDHTVSFIRLTFILMMIESLSSPVITCLLAVGKVKWYQIIVGGLLILNLPISYVALKFGATPEFTIQIAIVISFVSLMIRLGFLYRYISFPVKSFVLNVVGKSAVVAAVSYVLVYAVYSSLSLSGFLQLVVTVIVSWIISGSVILLLGMNQTERNMVKSALNKVLNKVGIGV